jgi:hypothetical protein
MAEKAYHIISSATLHSDSCNKAVPLYNPREQRWDEHFSWSEDYLRITGLTPIGRATVEALRLNREGLVNMRRILYAVGEHPPQETD